MSRHAVSCIVKIYSLFASFVMEASSRPVVVRFPAIILPPELQKMVDEADIDMIVANPSEVFKMSEESTRRVAGMVLYTKTYCKISGELMDCFPNLKVISNFGAGVDNVDVVAASERGIAVGNTPGVLSDCTADMAFALLMASARNIVEGDKISKSPETKQISYLHGYYGRRVTGSTIGIVGMGGIGSAVAKRANGFDMRIVYHNRNRREIEEKKFVLCTPLTKETANLITERELALMKSTATLVNIARGGIVNQTDLSKALQSGVIRAAAMDVTDPEPLPRDHPLLKLPNVIITPHMGSATVYTRMKMMEVVLMNLKAGLNGEKLPFRFN
ncbi:hypothetical protein pdam_00014238 [Pocillopora damicornis]|uniref:Glyoxylate reductase/hydroxypyruvate reductase n=1 Tax=Pocillopora damicornis TaxID=46731 RepID=A0A3M6UIE2_POCDA|nr:hypothetical protein pdam_00014238 [Pocillopora damicornis]